MEPITKNLLHKRVLNQKLMITAFTTLPRELELMILSYIPKTPLTILFEKEQLGTYIFFLVNEVEFCKQVGDLFDFSLLPKNLRKNCPFMLFLSSVDPIAIKYISYPIIDETDCFTIQFTEEQFNFYRKLALEEVRDDIDLFPLLCEKFRGDKDFIYNVIRENDEIDFINEDNFYKHFSEELKHDREFMMDMVKLLPYEYPLAEHFLSDRSFILEAVKFNVAILIWAEEFQNDREIVLTALKHDFNAIECLSEELSNDREIVLTTVRQSGSFLCFASDELRNDREIVLTAVRQNGLYLCHASDELKSDRDIQLEALRQNGLYLNSNSKEWKHILNILFNAMENHLRRSPLDNIGDSFNKMLHDVNEILLTV